MAPTRENIFILIIKGVQIKLHTISICPIHQKAHLKFSYQYYLSKVKKKAKSSPDLKIFFEIESHYVEQAGPKFMMLLPQPPNCWDYRPVPLYPAELFN
jgi:hypothetical protein